VHSAKRIIQARLAASLQLSGADPATPRPQTPREIEDHFDVVGPQILRDVVAAEKRALEASLKEDALLAQLRARTTAKAAEAAAARGAKTVAGGRGAASGAVRPGQETIAADGNLQLPAKEKKSAFLGRLGLFR
jgi:hypothetical protein